MAIEENSTRVDRVNRTQFFTFAQPPHELEFASGETLGPVKIAYETYGELNSARSNAILITHALTGDAHVAKHDAEDRPGWWETMVGPDKAMDTNKYFIICSNIVGGCQGSTGPASINEKTGKPYGLDFPLLTVRDMVEAQRFLMDHLGIEKLMAVVGGSMGGMQVLQWAVSYPERVRAAIPIGSTAHHSAQQIAFNEVGRQAIMADPNWNEGNYYTGEPPTRGLAIARMVGHITYLSDVSMAQKFGRKFKDHNKFFKFDTDFEVEGYLRSRGDNFVKRFDANSYLYITKAIDYFDLAEGKELAETLKKVTAKLLVIAFKGDWLYPSYQSQEIVRGCKLAGIDTTYCEICSSYGHDAFLVQSQQQSNLVSHFLNRIAGEKI